MKIRLAISATAFLLLAGCSTTPGRQTKVYQAGEKATADKLTYAVIDTQIYQRLGDDPNNPRVPQNRFYTIQLAVSSGASGDVGIPSLTLVDDSGKVYNELADGSGLQHWLGVVRKVSPAQTERGEILFDAPAVHYKLKLTDDTSPDDIYLDLPLSFVHEQMTNESGTAPTGVAAPTTVDMSAPAPATKKK